MKQEPTGVARSAAGGIPVVHGREDVNDWNALSYDEQRALLGLPDVRWSVAWQMLYRIGTRVHDTVVPMFEEIGAQAHRFVEAVGNVVDDTSSGPRS